MLSIGQKLVAIDDKVMVEVVAIVHADVQDETMYQVVVTKAIPGASEPTYNNSSTEPYELVEYECKEECVLVIKGTSGRFFRYY